MEPFNQTLVTGSTTPGDFLESGNNLSDVDNVSTARDNLGLGTAATKDVAATGDAASGEVVKGDDTRLTDSRTPTSHTHTASEVTDFDTEVANNTTVAANTSKLAGIEAGAEVNNISDVNATDLTDGGDSSLHYHSADRNRANHTGTQTLSTISDAGTIASQDANSVNITGGSVTGITDLAIADGGTGAGTASGARTNLDVYSTGEVDEYLGPKATAGGVAFDGAVGYAVLGVDVSSLFSSPFSFTWTYKPLSSPSSGTRIFQFGTSNNSNLNTASSTQFELFLNTDGTDGRYRWPYPTDYTKYYTFTLVIDPSDITSPVLYRDGVLQTRTTQNTPTGNVLVPSGDITCFGPVVFNNAQIRNLTIFNRALTATEVADLYRNGLAGIADADRWGYSDLTQSWAQGSSNNDFLSDNSSGTTVDVVANSTAGSAGARIYYPFTIQDGKTYTFTINVTSVTGTILVRACRETGTMSATEIGASDITSTGIYSHTFTSSRDDIGILLGMGANAAITGTITIMQEDGAIAAYPMDEGIGYQLHDISSNHYDGLLSTSGFTHLVPKTEGYIRDFGVDAYNGGTGNVELVDGTRDILPLGAMPISLNVQNNDLVDANIITGTIAIKKTAGGSSQNTVDTLTMYLSGSSSTKNKNYFALTANENNRLSDNRQNIALSASDADATDLDVRVDYQVIE